jgi:hypothetical protein
LDVVNEVSAPIEQPLLISTTPKTDAAVAWRDVSKAYPNGYEALRSVSLCVTP